MDDKRTRSELNLENEALYAELEDLHARIGELLDDGDEDGDLDGEGFDDDDT